MMLARPLFVALAAALAIAAPASAQKKANWNEVVVATPEGSHLIGNPDADVKLVEYVSYTCSHCASFEKESDAPLRLTFIATGKGSVEVRPLLRNKIDVAVALMAGCGPVSKFRGNHALFLRTQEKWFTDFSNAQQQRWESPDSATAMQAIARDLKLYDVLAGRGYTRIQLDRCLANKDAGSKLAQQSSHAINQLGVNSTPSFLINGEVQDVHDWSGLRPLLAALVR